MAEAKAVTTKSVMTSDEKESLIKSQSGYTGNSQSDRVKVTPVKDGSHVKKGKEYSVHPTTAQLWEHKGLIEKGWEKKVNTYNPPADGTSLKDKDVKKPLN